MTLLKYIFELHFILGCTPWSISNMKHRHTHQKQTNPKHQLRDQEILCKCDSTLFQCHILPINEMNSFWQCTNSSFSHGKNHDLKKTHHFLMSALSHINPIDLQWRRRRVSYGISCWLHALVAIKPSRRNAYLQDCIPDEEEARKFCCEGKGTADCAWTTFFTQIRLF